MTESSLIQQSMQSMQILPGVGPKTAQRMIYHLLQHERQRGPQMVETLGKLFNQIGACQRCRNFSETAVCSICADPKRNEKLLCVVETPSDVLAIEQTHAFKGYYFVLMGRLSPLDGIGPEQLGLPLLFEQMRIRAIDELLIATNPTVEGEATAYYLSEQCNARDIRCSRLASGIPMGGELEYLDGRTIEQAIQARQPLMPASKDEVL